MKLTIDALVAAYRAELEKMHLVGDEIDIAYGRIDFSVIIEDRKAKLVAGLYQTTKTYDLEKMRFTQPTTSLRSSK